MSIIYWSHQIKDNLIFQLCFIYSPKKSGLLQSNVMVGTWTCFREQWFSLMQCNQHRLKDIIIMITVRCILNRVKFAKTSQKSNGEFFRISQYQSIKSIDQYNQWSSIDRQTDRSKLSQANWKLSRFLSVNWPKSFSLLTLFLLWQKVPQISTNFPRGQLI